MQQFLDSWFLHNTNNTELQQAMLPEGITVYWTDLLDAVVADELVGWQKTPPGRLALIILCGPVARLLQSKHEKQLVLKAKSLCLRGVELGFDTQLNVIERRCFYEPLFQSSILQEQGLLQKLLSGMRAPAVQAEGAGLHVWQSWCHQAKNMQPVAL